MNIPKRRCQHLLYSEQFQLKTKESCQSRNLTSSFLSTFNVGAPHTTINNCIWLWIYICRINIFHICTFSYIIEDFFFGHQLEIWFCKIKFSINSTKKFKEKQEKNELKSSDFRLWNYLKWRIKEHKQTTAGVCGAGIFSTGQPQPNPQKCIIIGISLPCPVIFKWGSHYNWTAL